MVTNDTYHNFDDNEINSLIFTKEMTDNILIYDKTVQIIGIVDATEMKSNMMKFHLCNKEGAIIQCTVWDDLIEKMKSLIITGNVIYLDGGFARPKHTMLSDSTVSFDISVMSNTVVKILKKAEPYIMTDISKNISVPTVAIEESVKYTGLLEIVGYIKNSIRETSMPNKTKINQGCLSDCIKYKLEIRMPSLCDMAEFKVGSHVRMRGVIKYSAHPYLWVLRKEDVLKESDEIRKIVDVLKGTMMPKRIISPAENVVKREKTDTS